MYQVSLAQFEGPLDLLLHLIEKAEMDIKEIYISEITSQYLAYMEQLGTVDPDTASEFATMAATLLWIKSRSLLPRPVPVPEEEEDPEQALLRQIREYKAFKEAGERLGELKKAADAVFWRLPEEFPLPPQQFHITGATLEGLYEAFLAVLQREKERDGSERERKVARDQFSIADRLSYIRGCVRRGQRISFRQLFSDSVSRMELIVTFMALLELIAAGEVRTQQQDTFGEIAIEGCGEEESEEMEP